MRARQQHQTEAARWTGQKSYRDAQRCRSLRFLTYINLAKRIEIKLSAYSFKR
jgi:hypothetical protein